MKSATEYKLQILTEALEAILKDAQDPSENAYEGRNLWDNGMVMSNWNKCQNRLSDIKYTAEQALADDSYEYYSEAQKQEIESLGNV